MSFTTLGLSTVVSLFLLQLGCVTVKELLPHVLLLCLDCENGCLSPFADLLNNKMQMNLALNRNSGQNFSEKNFIFKGAIVLTELCLFLSWCPRQELHAYYCAYLLPSILI